MTSFRARLPGWGPSGNGGLPSARTVRHRSGRGPALACPLRACVGERDTQAPAVSHCEPEDVSERQRERGIYAGAHISPAASQPRCRVWMSHCHCSPSPLGILHLLHFFFFFLVIKRRKEKEKRQPALPGSRAQRPSRALCLPALPSTRGGEGPAGPAGCHLRVPCSLRWLLVSLCLGHGGKPQHLVFLPLLLILSRAHCLGSCRVTWDLSCVTPCLAQQPPLTPGRMSPLVSGLSRIAPECTLPPPAWRTPTLFPASCPHSLQRALVRGAGRGTALGGPVTAPSLCACCLTPLWASAGPWSGGRGSCLCSASCELLTEARGRVSRIFASSRDIAQGPARDE